MQANSISIKAPSRVLMMLEPRAVAEFGAYLSAMPLLRLAPKGDGHPVLVLPGLLASDLSTVPLRQYLSGLGYTVSGWGLGRNRGLRKGVEGALEIRLQQMAEKHGRNVSIVGWSLGGVYARLLASKFPELTRSVVSLGTPFAGSPQSTNAAQIYAMVRGARGAAKDERRQDEVARTPPVPTTSIFSRTDGVCAWQACLEEGSRLSENIEVEGSHCGLGHNPAALYAVADRLSQPEGFWRKFDRSGWRSILYPDPAR